MSERTPHSQPEPAPTGRRYRFGPWTLDARSGELWRDGEAVALEPLPVRILARLVEAAGRMVTRAELRALGWPRLPDVADDSLNTCIRQIREALGDDARAPVYVQTLRGRGYRFLPTVHVVGPLDGGRRPGGGPPDHPEPPGPPRRRTRRATAGAAVVGAALCLVALSAATGVWGRAASGVPEPRGGDAPAARQAPAVGLDPAVGVEAPVGADPVRAELARVDFLAHRGEPVRALEVADRAATAHPDRSELHGARAELLALLGRRQDARRAAGVARALDDAEVRALRAEALVSSLEGRWRTASAYADRAVRVGDGSESRMVRAFVRALAGRTEEAESDVAAALAWHPLSPVVRHDAGLVHFWTGRFEAAAEACSDVVALAPEMAWARLCELDARSAAGDQEGARAVARGVLEGLAGRPPGDATADPVREVWRWRLERARAAEAAYETAVALTALGRDAAALAALERAASGGGYSVLAVAVDPRLAPLRGRPRFEAVVARLGLAPYRSSTAAPPADASTAKQ